jgi:hypothetical protein
MIVRLDIDPAEGGHFDYRVSHEAELLFADESLASVVEALVAAVEGLAPETLGIELALDGIVSGTYTLDVIAMNVVQVATHAQNTTDAIREASAR